jgi:ABC-2 type transport system permease protein
MRVYLEVARRAFQRLTTYRGATFAGAFTNSVFGFLLAYVLLAVYAGRPEINGFTVADAVTFTFVAQGLLSVMGVFGGETEMAQRIRTGDVVVDLYRPVDYEAWWAAVDFGRGAFYLVFRGIPPFVVGLVAFDEVRPPPATWLWPAFLVSVILGAAAGYSFRFILQSVGFWLLDVRGAVQLGWVAAMFFSGMIVPLFLFPPGLEAVARHLPFASMMQLPIEVFLGHHTGADLVATLATQAGWAALLALCGRLMLVRATRKVVVQGG